MDAYVLNVMFDRLAVAGFQSDDNLKALLVRQGAHFDQGDDGELRRINPPSWLEHEDYKQLQ